MPAPMALRGVRAVGGALLRPPSGALFRRALATIRRRTKCHSIGRYTERGLSTMPKAQSRWHHLYCTTVWRRRAKHQLRSQPLCEMCLKDGRINAATIADHVEPHKGDQQKFFFGELQSLCKLHHESAKKREETRGYSTQIGADGWPVDPRHPVYSRGRGA